MAGKVFQATDLYQRGFSSSDGSRTGLRQPRSQLLSPHCSMSETVHSVLQGWVTVSSCSSGGGSASGRQKHLHERAMLNLSKATEAVVGIS